jgi:hypothetical protein
MRLYRFAAPLLLALLLTAPAPAQTPQFERHERQKPPDAAELKTISERGRDLAAYDAAAWYGSDAVEAMKPADGLVEMYVGRKTDQGWAIGFGALDATKTKFSLAYEAVPTTDIKKPSVVAHDPAIEDTDIWLRTALAFETAKEKLGDTGRAYNLAVLPAPQGQWFVYGYPAQIDLSTFPCGGDTRYLITASGTTILETRRMHASILETKWEKDQTPEMTYHTAFLDDAPEDSDVANVIMMGHIPMLIVSTHFAFQISADGSINYLGTAKEFLKKAK